MAVSGRTWWGKRFLAALEACMDAGRLQRGKSYNSPYRILRFEIKNGVVQAKVRGNVNPYFGVKKEPRYDLAFRLRLINKTTWKKIIKEIANNPTWLMKLFMRQMPDDIEEAFLPFKKHLLPSSSRDIVSECSCPDWANPCKHIAGVYFKVAELLDQNPFILFELRGLKINEIIDELSATPLGKALSKELLKEKQTAARIEPVFSKYKMPERNKVTGSKKMVCSYKEFWHGKPVKPPEPQKPKLPALLIKKEGDYPPFWPRNNSFLLAMEEIYNYVVRKMSRGNS